jgi:hypothetical protein
LPIKFGVMIVKPAQPFGRRGLAPQKPASPNMPARVGAAATTELPANLVAAIVRPAGREAETPGRPRVKVARSLRAAFLAGLCVGFFNAAINVAGISGVANELVPLIGTSGLPLPVMFLVIGLWRAARTTGLALLVSHRILDRLGQTSPAAYALGGGIVNLAYAAAVQVLAPDWHHSAFIVEFASGLAAGFFYRLFAGTGPADQG